MPANQERDDALGKVKSYDELLTAAGQYVSGDQVNAVEALGSIREEDLEGSAKTLYDNMKGGVSDVLFNQYYTAGTTAYAGRDYRTAAEQLTLAAETDENGSQANYFNALYYLGFAYYNLKEYAQADEVFNTIMEKYPSRAYEVQPYITGQGNAGGTAGVSSGSGSSQGEASMNQDSITVYGIDPANVPGKIELTSSGDHRMAMCAVLLAEGLGREIAIDDITCLDKSFPAFRETVEREMML